MAAAKSQVARPVFWLASAMFFLSGGTGLAYQVIWFKRFAHVWGSSSLAFASVGASFLFGLGLGAYLIGRWADRLSRPLRWYGICELIIGILALVIPFEIQWLIEVSAGFYSQLPEEPVWRYLVQSSITLLIVGPPCVLMGGTLPLLIRELTAREGSLDQATGWLYAINTFGAATGCYLTGFHLLPAFGLLWTNNAAAALNLSIGVLSIAASQRVGQRRSQRSSPTAAVEVAVPNANYSLVGLYLAVTLSGLGALILEMTWSRQLALVLGGSTYAYSSTLFVVLVGIALGSLIFHFGLQRFASYRYLPLIVIGVLVVACLIGKSTLPQLSIFMGDHRKERISAVGNALMCVSAALWLELIPSIAMGILFPLFVHLTHRTAAAAGRTVGDVYAWNTFGSIAGASLTAVLLFPWIGTAGSIALATGLYVLALVLVVPWQTRVDRIVGGVSVLAGTAMVAGILVPADPMFTNVGMYMYGNQSEQNRFDLIYFAEGASSNVLITRADGRNTNLRVNGKVDASDDMDMLMQAGLGYFPRIFKPDAKEVLVIGFGSGTTSGTSLLFPDTHVTCCEIEPAVYRGSKYFAHVNHKPQEQSKDFLLTERRKSLSPGEKLSADEERKIAEKARFSVVFGDGRTTLQGSDKKYDLILSEPSNPWLAGVSNLFTAEFFEAANKHLNDGGVLAQWIQTYNFALSDYLMIVRTLRTQFKHCGLILLAEGADTILLASNSPLMPTKEGIKHMQHLIDSSPVVARDFSRWYGTTDVRLLLMRYFGVSEAEIMNAVAKSKVQQLNTDLNLRLEFAAPLHLYKPPPEPEDARLQLRRLTSREWRNTLADAVGIAPDSSEYELAEADLLIKEQKVDEAFKHYQNALARNPNSVDALRGLATVLIQKKKHPEAVLELQKALQLDPGNRECMGALAQELILAKRTDEAVKVMEDLLKIDPENIAALSTLSQQYMARKRHAETIELLQRLIRISPRNADAHGLLGQEYLEFKQLPKAVVEFREALRLKPKLVAKSQGMIWANNLAWILATNPRPELRNADEAIRWSKQACEAVEFKQMEFVDTLAAAYAEDGQFDEAIRLAQKFLDHAEAAGQTQAIELARSRLKLYQSKQPVREG